MLDYIQSLLTDKLNLFLAFIDDNHKPTSVLKFLTMNYNPTNAKKWFRDCVWRQIRCTCSVHIYECCLCNISIFQFRKRTRISHHICFMLKFKDTNLNWNIFNENFTSFVLQQTLLVIFLCKLREILYKKCNCIQCNNQIISCQNVKLISIFIKFQLKSISKPYCKGVLWSDLSLSTFLPIWYSVPQRIRSLCNFKLVEQD